MNTSKIQLTLMLALLGMTQVVAQEYEYVPFVREGVKWVYYYKNNGDVVYPADPRLSYGTVYLNLEIKGDTVIDGKIYKAMHKYHGDAINSENDTIPIFLREDDKVVYGLVPDGIKYPDCPIGNPYEEFLFEQIDNGEEFILYDFNDPINYWSSRIPKYNDEESSGYNYLYTDTIALGHHLAKRYVATRDYLGEFSMIEGIGVDARGPGYTLFPFRPMAAGVNTYFGFSHVIEDGEIIYKGVNYTEPEPNDSDGYLPIVREGVKWVYYYDSPFETASDEFIPQGRHYYTLELKGDTVIDGKHYKPMHLYSGDAINEESDTIPVYLREENKVVYALAIDDKRYAECPIGIGEDCLVTYNSIICPIVTGQEYILYDFNDPAGLYEYHDSYSGLYSYIGSYQVLIGDRLRKCHSFSTSGMAFSGYVIEGIGYAGGDQGGTPLCYFYPYITGLQVIYVLSHVIENGEIIYRQADLEQLLQPDDYEYVPFVREGVKWVYYFINENGLYPPDENLPEGITTYTLELKGDTIINGKTYKAMHKYYGKSINWDNDTVPVYLREEDKVVYAIVPDGRRYYDCPLGNYFSSVDPYNGEEYVLYDFQNPEEFWNSTINEYEDGVYEPCGNDTITVGHHKAKRHIGWAMGRDEYDKFYSIEGIGLDSWRPGTPLCFFRLGTPWPAPVFFSHVIEDGEIIYKSVYNYWTDVLGDVDGDGEVTIADANSVIDIVVMGGNAGHTRIPGADVNGDGEVNIADVNAIIDMILRNN